MMFFVFPVWVTEDKILNLFLKLINIYLYLFGCTSSSLLLAA